MLSRRIKSLGQYGAVFLSLCVVSCSSSQPTDRQAPTAIKVSVQRVCAVPLQTVARADATISSQNRVEISAQLSAQLASKMQIKDGESVRKGDVLVQLTDNGSSQDQVDNAKIQAAQKLKVYQQAQQLYKQGVKTKQELDDAQLASESAALQLHQAQIALAKLTLKAPISGTVSNHLDLAQGATVTPNQVLMTITDPDHLRVEYALPEQWFTAAKVNQPVQIYDASSHQFIAQGVSDAKSAVVDAKTGSFTMAAVLKKSDNSSLYIGQSVTLNQLVGKPVQGFRIPLLSVHTDASGFSVYTVKDHHAHQVAVSLGDQRQGSIQVLHGLKTGDQVIVRGQLKVRDGSLVSVTPQSSDAECHA